MSRVLGGGRIRRLFKTLPDTVNAELAGVLQAAGPKLLSGMQQKARTLVKVRTGRLLAGLSYKFYPKTLRLRVGFLGKRTNQKLFYAHILEFGRKAQTVRVSRRIETGSVLVHRRRVAHPSYTLRVKAMPARHIVLAGKGASAQTDLRREITDKLKGIWSRAISKAAAGGGGDD